MTDYASRIASLKSEQTRIAQRQVELAAQRRQEIGKLADRLGVLCSKREDEVLAGLLLELKTAIQSDSPRLAQWRDAGRYFRPLKSERQQGYGADAAPDRSGTDKSASA